MGEAMDEVGGDGFLLSPIVTRRNIAEIARRPCACAAQSAASSGTATTTARFREKPSGVLATAEIPA